MKSWHSFYHKKVHILGPALTAPNAPPDAFTPEEEEGLVHFLASGGSFMIDTTPLLYNVSSTSDLLEFLRSLFP